MSVEVFGYCDANCKHRVLTLDQTAELIQEMAANNWQVPEGFMPKTAVNSIIEQNTGKELKLFVGTQAEFNALSESARKNLFAIISDDPTLANIENLLKQHGNSIDSIVSGKTPVSVLRNDGTMGQLIEDKNGVLKFGNVIIPQEIKLWSGEYIPAENSDFQNLTSTLQCGDIIRVEYRFKSNEDFANDFVEFRLPSEEYTSVNMLIEKGLITAKIVITNYNKFKAGITTAYKVNSDYTISNNALAESQFAICGITKIIR